MKIYLNTLSTYINKVLYYVLHIISLLYPRSPHLIHSPFPTDHIQIPCPADHWGPQCLCFEDNTAYYGNNHRFGDENPQKTRLDCQQSCEFHPSCEYWTFRKPIESGEAGLCYLKLKRENVRSNVTDYVSGSKTCRLPEWTGR